MFIMKKFIRKYPYVFLCMLIPLDVLIGWGFDELFQASHKPLVYHLYHAAVLTLVACLAVYCFRKGWKAGNDAARTAPEI
jgi:hypothetical protein